MNDEDGAVDGAQAQAALDSLKGQFKKVISSGETGPQLNWDWDGPHPVVVWPTGPFEWVFAAGSEGGEADGIPFPPAENWPSGVWAQPVTEGVLRLLPTD